MARITGILALLAIVLGIAGLAVATERTSAQIPPHDTRFDLQCQQTVEPTGAGTKGEVTCSLRIDIPDNLTPPLPDTIKLTIVVTYVDVNGDGDPSHGDRLQCIRVTVPDGTVVVDRCRPAVPPSG